MLVTFQIPNRFFEADGRALDFVGNDWEKTWGEVNERQEHAKFA